MNVVSSIRCKQCGMVNWATASECKRCGASLHAADGVAASRDLPETGYPRAHMPHKARPGEVVKPCLHCGKDLALARWDSWNGFLVQCPHCGGLHGKRWDSRRVLFASFLFNAFSFLFTMRPPKAFLALLAFVVFAVVGNFVLDNEMIPDMLEIVGAAIFFLGPLLINAIVLIKHERDLEKPALQH